MCAMWLPSGLYGAPHSANASSRSSVSFLAAGIAVLIRKPAILTRWRLILAAVGALEHDLERAGLHAGGREQVAQPHPLVDAIQQRGGGCGQWDSR